MNTPTSEDESETRRSHLVKLMPELEKTKKGDELSLNQFPHLKNIVQTGFQSLNGVNKFTESMFYAIPG